jgi:hypothetical protein
MNSHLLVVLGVRRMFEPSRDRLQLTVKRDQA